MVKGGDPNPKSDKVRCHPHPHHEEMGKWCLADARMGQEGGNGEGTRVCPQGAQEFQTLFSPQNVIAEHEIRNISCAAQDPEDLCIPSPTSPRTCRPATTIATFSARWTWWVESAAGHGGGSCDSPSAVGPGTRLALSKGLFKNEHHSSPLYLALRLKHTG